MEPTGEQPSPLDKQTQNTVKVIENTFKGDVGAFNEWRQSADPREAHNKIIEWAKEVDEQAKKAESDPRRQVQEMPIIPHGEVGHQSQDLEYQRYEAARKDVDSITDWQELAENFTYYCLQEPEEREEVEKSEEGVNWENLEARYKNWRDEEQNQGHNIESRMRAQLTNQWAQMNKVPLPNGFMYQDRVADLPGGERQILTHEAPAVRQVRESQLQPQVGPEQIGPVEIEQVVDGLDMYDLPDPFSASNLQRTDENLNDLELRRRFLEWIRLQENKGVGDDAIVSRMRGDLANSLRVGDIRGIREGEGYVFERRNPEESEQNQAEVFTPSALQELMNAGGETAQQYQENPPARGSSNLLNRLRR